MSTSDRLDDIPLLTFAPFSLFQNDHHGYHSYHQAHYREEAHKEVRSSSERPFYAHQAFILEKAQGY